MENRKVILEFGPHDQPEGRSGGLFGTWLGMLSADLSKFPINYDDWRKVQDWRKDDAWNYIQSKFYFDGSNENHKNFVMKSLGTKCRGLKTRLWTHLQSKTLEEALEIRPEFIPKEQWQDFVRMQFSEKTQTLRVQNKRSKSFHDMPHTLGKKSIARLSKEILIKTRKRPSRAEIFVSSRRKADGSFVNEKAQDLTEKLKEKMAQTKGVTSRKNDEFFQVFGFERSGRVRCVGLGPTLCTFFQNRTISTSEAEVVALKNQVHHLEKRLEGVHDLEEKYDKMNDLINSLINSSCDCRRNN